MRKNPLLILALMGLFGIGLVGSGFAAETPVDDGAAVAAPEEEGEPYPPDGVTDPDVVYPTDEGTGAEGGEGTDEDVPAAGDGSSLDARD